VERIQRQTWLSWAFVAALAVSSALLGFLQYSWTGEVSQAERERLRNTLQLSLNRLSQNFNSELSAACIPITSRGARGGDEPIQISHLIKSAYRAMGKNGSLMIEQFVPERGDFVSASWPPEWSGIRERLEARIAGERPAPFASGGRLTSGLANVVELPIMPQRGGPPEPFEGRREPSGWYLFEFNLDYIRSTILPGLLQQYIGESATADYWIEVKIADSTESVLYTSEPDAGARIGEKADATVRLFEVRFDPRHRPGSPGRPEPGRFERPPEFSRPPNMERRGPGFGGFERGRWQLAVRHRSGSLEALVERARIRNLAVTGVLLTMIVAAGAILVQFTRRAQRLTGLQMQFVAGVSHELRTPLSVMRTAGHNLQSNVALDPVRVRRYGSLIEEQSQRLTAIVEQILRFANVKAGRVIGARQLVSPAQLIDAALASSRGAIAESGCVVEKNIAPGLPPVLADAGTLQHALQNLIENGAKYGKAGGWIGIDAATASGGDLEIRIRDRGPGIPPNEVAQVFDPFYRGKRSVEDQIHGTGLGLTLAKRIIESHGGRLSVISEPDQGTEFIVRLAAEAVGKEDHVANSAD
jgi:signal transduction histidine kinase